PTPLSLLLRGASNVLQPIGFRASAATHRRVGGSALPSGELFENISCNTLINAYHSLVEGI
ncbi:MAG: hypothetical protein ABJO54_05010, partial [Hyphomicrobiales bacterium]